MTCWHMTTCSFLAIFLPRHCWYVILTTKRRRKITKEDHQCWPKFWSKWVFGLPKDTQNFWTEALDADSSSYPQNTKYMCRLENEEALLDILCILYGCFLFWLVMFALIPWTHYWVLLVQTDLCLWKFSCCE
jgi:hypothetical protein